MNLIIINNYSPKWRWLAVDIYRAAKRRGIHDFGEKSVRHDFGAKIARTQPRGLQGSQISYVDPILRHSTSTRS